MTTKYTAVQVILALPEGQSEGVLDRIHDAFCDGSVADHENGAICPVEVAASTTTAKLATAYLWLDGATGDAVGGER